MVNQPPPLPGQPIPKNLKLAGALNTFLPGAGLFYLGSRFIGVLLAGAFLACFMAIASLFLTGYGQYLSTAMSDDLMRGDNLERAADGFHQPWLIGLGVAGGVIYLIATILFNIARRRFTA